MPKQVIVSMQNNYPFGQCEEVTSETTRVLVRKIYQLGLQEQNNLLEKVGILRKLKNEHMIKIQSVLQEQESVHFMFEYIPIKLQTWISNINDQFIENFRDQLIKFSNFLANNHIKIQFQLKNIGMDQNYGAKYFLDLDFDIDRSTNRQKLKSIYIREITNLFKPYIMHTNAKVQNSQGSDREIISADYSSKPGRNVEGDGRNMSSISPPTNKTAAKYRPTKSKDKALEKYYQDVNMSVDSENQKILQEFMDVLDNQDEENVHKGSKVTHPTHPTSQTKLNVSHRQAKQPFPQQQPEPCKDKRSTVIAPKPQISPKAIPVPQPPITKEPIIPNRIDNIEQAMHQLLKPPEELKNPVAPSEPTNATGKVWRSSSELQDRVNKAIEKSIAVIKKLKKIKQNMHN